MSSVERFVGGAIGEPGDREFRLEFVVSGQPIAYVLEKLQVAAMAEEAQRLLRDRNMIGVGLGVEPGEVHEDTPLAYRVGGLQLSLEDDSDIAHMTIFSTEDADPPAEYDISLPQLDAFARVAVVAVASGRPPCPRCGLAMDPDGHNCPRTNGDLRGHRP